jgi:AcrR family transcriptional regulator
MARRERRTETKPRRAKGDAPRKSGRPANPLSRAAILALARPVFAERGVDAVTTRDVADLAGIRKPSLYHHFASKAELYEAVLDEDISALLSLISQANLDDGSFLDRIDRLGSLITDYLSAHPAAARLLTRELVGGGPYLAARGGARVQETLAVTAAFLEAGMDAGELRRADPRQLAVSIAGLHLFAFAAPDSVTPFLGPLHEAEHAALRKAAVLEQVRALVTNAGRPPPP